MSDLAVFLLVEDNEDDVLLVERAFQKAEVLNPLQVVRKGDEAVDYLSGCGKYANRTEYPLPRLVLLDIKMPGVDGFEVLRWIRLQPQLNALRVIMLTSSNDMRDVTKAYQLGANSFLVKPVDFERFVEISQALAGHWLWMDKTPGGSGASETRGDQCSNMAKFLRSVLGTRRLPPADCSGKQHSRSYTDQPGYNPLTRAGNSAKPALILAVEDNEDDSFLMRRAFQRANILNRMEVVKNGAEAIAYLKGEHQYANRTEYPLPELMLLDLKMPGVDGFEVLRWVRGQPAFRELRVVVLTSSVDVRDVNLAFELGANSFMIKPVDFVRFVEFSEALAGHWLWLDKGRTSDPLAKWMPASDRKLVARVSA